MNRFRKAILAVALAAPLAAAGTAFAHGPGGGMGDHGPRVEQRLSNLKSKLAITGGQETQWQAFEQAINAQVTRAQSLRQQAAPATGTAPELFARRAEHMKQHLAGMETVGSALSNLYTVLTPDQRSVIDQHYARMGRRGGPGQGQGPRAHGYGHEHGHGHGHGQHRGPVAPAPAG